MNESAKKQHVDVQINTTQSPSDDDEKPTISRRRETMRYQ
jgi:hypothetical protein